MWGNGFYKPKSLEAGTSAVREVDPITQSFFAMEIRVMAKLILRKKSVPQGVEEKGKC